MKKLIQLITDHVTTKKGVAITLLIWLIGTGLLAMFAPSARDYVVSSVDTLPGDAQSVVAQQKIDDYFPGDDTIPALLVFQSDKKAIQTSDLTSFIDTVKKQDIKGVEGIVPINQMPPQALSNFFSDDKKTIMIPLSFDSTMESKDLATSLDQINDIAKNTTDFTFYATGPAGIAADAHNLFTRADVVLILATVGIILILLMVIYRSPLLALIPLIAAGFVYEVVNQILGMMGEGGLTLANQSLSIMSILLFAALTDYSLFIFSRYREELANQESKHGAMKTAMRGVGMPVFYSGGTVLIAMLILLFAKIGDYQNFAPIFGTTMAVVMIASITLVPALFTLFGRKAFWPKVPAVGDSQVKKHAFWGKIGRFVTKKPIASIVVVGIFLIAAASNMTNISHEFDMMKSFPDDMQSRAGFEVLDDAFGPGVIAPTTVLVKSEKPLSNQDQELMQQALTKQPDVDHVRLNKQTDDKKATTFDVAFTTNPYTEKTMDALQQIIDHKGQILADSQIDGNLYFAGETASTLDNRTFNDRDLIVIMTLESLFIFMMLILLTKSFKMPLYMMGTILVSYTAALGLGSLLAKVFFNIDKLNNEISIYTFVFLVALGIDYNIMLISRYLEERVHHPVKKAVEIAVTNTGGVISSAGIILAGTFAVLMTQPVELLFVFGFIVAVGIIIDTFLVRGVLLPGLITLFEKDKTTKRIGNKHY